MGLTHFMNLSLSLPHISIYLPSLYLFVYLYISLSIYIYYYYYYNMCIVL